ncbi:pyridoxal phosphate-dependent transferase [Pelagophyceae sp. CCMP2097]|nr:pyridoxal phosphate-dependent transferase [Pelagophyceae sp. CCMP2097]
MAACLSRGDALLVAGAAAFVTGALDGPRFARYLRFTVWTPVALALCIAKRLSARGEPSPSVLQLVVQKLERLGPRLSPYAGDVAGVILIGALVGGAARARRLTFAEVKSAITAAVVDAARCVPHVERLVALELKKVEADLQHSLKPNGPRADALISLPAEAFKGGRAALAAQLVKKAKEEDLKWQSGGVSGAVYSGDADHLNLMNAAAAAYAVANPLHPDIWPSVNAMEAEVISMTARLLDGGDADVCGALASGGTESIVLAAKAARDKLFKDRGITRGEVVACVTAHAAIDKACDLLGLRLVKVPTDGSYRCDVAAMRRAMTADTVLVYASAPSFPQGTIDDVSAISEMAFQAGICCHVDCCLGGFVLPFLQRNKANGVPRFDFGLRGVTSMSVDTHKYGYAPKGSSVVLYRSPSFRKHQYFCYPAWTGGLYVTPTIAGSRSGSVIAATWASLVSIGGDGLASKAQQIADCANVIAHGIKADMPELQLCGAREDGDRLVDAMIVCFESSSVNVYEVNDDMVHRGWTLNGLQSPASVHLCCTLQTLGHEQRFLDDLKMAVAKVVAAGGGASAGSAAIYGMASSMPAGPVEDVLMMYTDITLAV